MYVRTYVHTYVRTYARTDFRIFRFPIFLLFKLLDLWIFGLLIFWIFGIFNYWAFSKFWKDNSSKIGFSMTSYPDVSLFHVSTTFREIIYKKQFFQTRKMSAFCLKLTYTLFEKMYEVTKNTIFDFSFFPFFWKTNSSEIDLSTKSYPTFVLFTTLRCFVNKHIQ